MVVVRGRLRVAIDGQTSDLGPGEGFLAPPNVEHRVTALEDTEVLSCKGLVDGRGHRISRPRLAHRVSRPSRYSAR